MKNVTITLDETVASQARVAAATQGKSLSRFISELVERAVAGQPKAQLEILEKFFSGPGVPGISKNWRGREELYAEREDEHRSQHEAGDGVEHRKERIERGAQKAVARERIADGQPQERADDEAEDRLRQRHADIEPDVARGAPRREPLTDSRDEERRPRVVEGIEHAGAPQPLPRADEKRDNPELKRTDEPFPPREWQALDAEGNRRAHDAERRLRSYERRTSSRKSDQARS